MALSDDIFTMFVGEELDFAIDWSDDLTNSNPDGAADTVDSSTWVVPAGLTKGTDTFTSTKSVVWLTAVTKGVYDVEGTIVTDGGRTYKRTLHFYVKERS